MQFEVRRAWFSLHFARLVGVPVPTDGTPKETITWLWDENLTYQLLPLSDIRSCGLAPRVSRRSRHLSGICWRNASRFMVRKDSSWQHLGNSVRRGAVSGVSGPPPTTCRTCSGSSCVASGAVARIAVTVPAYRRYRKIACSLFLEGALTRGVTWFLPAGLATPVNATVK